jgi:peptidoglycan/xylan/chitin deacetylase (PgdA/CDA1 family)
MHTRPVLEQLAKNPVQQGIKAIFFVQTRNAEGGGSPLGRSLLQQEHREGHVLGLHTGTPRGHVSHTAMSRTELGRSLRNGADDIRAVTHRATVFVRPPYWRFNDDTLAGYAQHGLQMMLSDVKAYDGLDWGLHVLRHWNFRTQLAAVRRRMFGGRMPDIEGTAPIVVTFHDTNAYTAGHMSEYLDLLVNEAERAGLPLDEKPFYDDAPDIMRAALQRAVTGTVPIPEGARHPAA